jgi:hypothetical protein
VATVLSIPSIRKVRLGGMVDDDAHELQLSPKCSNVEQLTLENVGMSFHCLVKILLSCKNLKCFSYHTPVDPRVSRELSALLQILEAFGDSLEEIQIMHLPNLGVFGTPHSFSGFPALRHLVCDASVLTHPLRRSTLSLLLPKTIRKIHIHGIYAEFKHQFGDFESIRGDLLQRVPDGAPYFAGLHEVRLVKGTAVSRQDVFNPETCTEVGVVFSVEQFGTRQA